MDIVSLIKLFLSLASKVAEYARDRQLMEAGASEEILRGIKDAQDKVAIARNARNNVDGLPVDKDPANRANKH